MENIMLKNIRTYLSELKRIEELRQNRYNELQEYTGYSLIPGKVKNGITYYNYRKRAAGKVEYAGSQKAPLVINIQQARYLKKSLDIIQKDIALIESFLEKYESISFHHVSSQLPKAYRNVKASNGRTKKKLANSWKKRMEIEKAKYPIIRPEELTQPTIDGNKVRSRGEALIYNYLYEAGYTFVYELPIEGKTRTFYPDFTILSEIDYRSVIRIEHQGMMNDSKYKDKSETREYDYWKNGLLPNRDVYFTYDDNMGNFDIGPIIDILTFKVRPRN